MFAAISVKGLTNGSKLLEGPVPTWKYFGSPKTANGGERTPYGLPRFQSVDFQRRLPIREILQFLRINHLPLLIIAVFVVCTNY